MRAVNNLTAQLECWSSTTAWAPLETVRGGTRWSTQFLFLTAVLTMKLKYERGSVAKVFVEMVAHTLLFATAVGELLEHAKLSRQAVGGFSSLSHAALGDGHRICLTWFHAQYAGLVCATRWRCMHLRPC